MLDRARVIGERCYLRPFEREDVSDRYLSWINDANTNEFILGATFPVSREMLVEFYEASQPPHAAMFAICCAKSGAHIGNARLGSIDRISRSATYGWLIGEKEFRGGGYGTDALICLLRFGFHHLGLHRIWSMIAAENKPSLGISDKIGMTREGLHRQSVWANGHFHDAVSVAILREEFDDAHGGPQDWLAREAEIRARIEAGPGDGGS